jgi:hypothetical protein
MQIIMYLRYVLSEAPLIEGQARITFHTALPLCHAIDLK